MADILESINAELDNIDNVVLELEDICSEGFEDKHHIQAAALLLHNLYNGFENILKYVCKNYNIRVSKSENWHKELLSSVTEAGVINKTLAKKLSVYLRFRHFVSHSYSFHLEIDLFLPLIKDAGKTLVLFKKAILKYIS